MGPSPTAELAPHAGPPSALLRAAGPRAGASPSSAVPGTHLCDFASTKVRKTLQREREDVGGSVDREAFAGQNFLLASAQEELELVQLFHHAADCQPWASGSPSEMALLTPATTPGHPLAATSPGPAPPREDLTVWPWSG